MRVLFIQQNPFYPKSGENLRAHYLLDELVLRGHSVDVVCPKADVPKKKGVRYFFSAKTGRFAKNKEISYVLFALRSFFLKGKLEKKYDVVYSFGISSSFLASRYIGFVPVVADYYEVDFLELRTARNSFMRLGFSFVKLWNRFFLQKCRKILVLSRQMQKYVQITYGCKSSVVYDAGDVRLFSRLSYKKPKVFTFIFHGGIEKRDGLDVFIRACAGIHRPFKAVIVGEGSSLASLKKLVQDLGLSDRFIFTGWMPYESVPAYLSRASCGIIPVTKVANNLMVPSRKVFEYMARGLILVLPDFDVYSELHPKGAFFFSSDDEKSLRSALISAMKKGVRKSQPQISIQSEMKKICDILEVI